MLIICRDKFSMYHFPKLFTDKSLTISAKFYSVHSGVHSPTNSSRLVDGNKTQGCACTKWWNFFLVRLFMMELKKYKNREIKFKKQVPTTILLSFSFIFWLCRQLRKLQLLLKC